MKNKVNLPPGVRIEGSYVIFEDVTLTKDDLLNMLIELDTENGTEWKEAFRESGMTPAQAEAWLRQHRPDLLEKTH